MNNNFKAAYLDFYQSFFNPRLWVYLSWQDVRQRYRRSLIGPFWISISTAITVCAMGPLYSNIFNVPASIYFKYFIVGFVLWSFISTFLNEVSLIYIHSSDVMRDLKIPYLLFPIRCLSKNIIVLFHNLVIVAAIVIIYPPSNIYGAFLAIPGLIILCLNLMWMGIVLALICARFRDFHQIILNILQILFFITPILWQPSMLHDYASYLYLNPIYDLLELVRAPLCGDVFNLYIWIIGFVLFFTGSFLTFILFSFCRVRITYWI